LEHVKQFSNKERVKKVLERWKVKLSTQPEEDQLSSEEMLLRAMFWGSFQPKELLEEIEKISVEL